MTIDLLIIGDALLRNSLREGLEREGTFRIAGAAADPRTARDMIIGLVPKVILLGVDTPKMDAIGFLRRVMKHFPLPVIAISWVDPRSGGRGREALMAGASEVVQLRSERSLDPASLQNLVAVIRRVRASWKDPRSQRGGEQRLSFGPVPIVQGIGGRIVAIGASTGGTHALQEVLSALPEAFPGSLVVQHMPKAFTGPFAKRLDSLCSVHVREAEDGDAVVAGRVLIAPGDRHMVIERHGLGYVVRIRNGPRRHHQRPSVDALFESMATHVGANSIAVLLTGMGSDGAEGLLAIRNAGGQTIAQDESTSVIFGMPKEAIRLGAAERILPLPMIGPSLIQLVQRPPGRRSA